MSYSASFRCVAGCHGTYPLDQVIYNCPECGELLEVHHDMDALRNRSGSAWIKLFDQRWMTRDWPYGSGVWGKKEWVQPNLREENVVSTAEGGTNLFWAERYGKTLGLKDVWIKNCGNSHTGSFKDLGMTVLVSTVKQMIEDGKPIRAIACASTGDTSAALAAYCASAGIPSVVLLPKGKVTTAQLVQPLANGALVCALDTDFDGCMAIVQKLTNEEGIYLANSMNSLRLDDMMFELGLTSKRPRLCLAQAEKANPLYRAYKQGWDSFEAMTAEATEASAIRIGNPVSVRRAIRALKAFDGVVEQASESELAEASAAADRAGSYTCPHTGVALAALEKIRAKGLVEPGQRAVVIATANGLKFTQFKIRYHENEIPGVQSKYPNRPISLPSEFEAVKAAVFKELEARAK
ncbi:MAG: pyridoxal-phosphate dependent enzyme [Deltaproteobacteria bacterium]|nr:pyridoxal-phosphate dependent enzyme [Deltaproteobacteria bacterium]